MQNKKTIQSAKNRAMQYTEEQMKLLLTVQDMVREEVKKQMVDHKPSKKK